MSLSKRFFLVFSSITILNVSYLFALNLPMFPTSKRPVTTIYHGTSVVDNYQWLENDKDSEVEKWTSDQNKQTEEFLKKLPNLPKIKKTLKSWADFKSPTYYSVNYRNGQYLALKLVPPNKQAMLIGFTSIDQINMAKVILDPNLIDASGRTTIDFYKISYDGKKVAVSLSKNGSEIGDLHIFSIENGKELGDVIPEVTKPTGGGSIEWNEKSTGFWYTRYPKKGEKPESELSFYQQIYFHELGTPIDKDTYSIGKDFPKIAEIMLSGSPDGQYLLASVANGDGGEFSHYLLGPKAQWKKISDFADKITMASIGGPSDLFLVSVDNAPKGKILKLSLENPDLKTAVEIVKETEATIDFLVPSIKNLMVSRINGGLSEVSIYDSIGNNFEPIALEKSIYVNRINSIANNDFLISLESYTHPREWFTYHPLTKKLVKSSLKNKSAVSFNDIIVKREFAISKDGTLVPVSILYKKGLKLNGKNPTILYGYGGYGVSLIPYFNQKFRFWFDQGGVYVIANLRGGGEFGENWHLSGNLLNKQNVFDDFISCAEFLIKTKYTSSNKLAFEGGSNGGLLMGAVLTQRPDLMKVVVSHVGIYDMLHVENDSNGTFNITEFGSTKDPDQFKALYAYSPYHNVKDGTPYPTTLLMTGVHDGRVNPYHSKKMTARLQAANIKDTPILLRVNYNSGHGIGNGTDEKVNQDAEVYAFILQALNIENIK